MKARPKKYNTNSRAKARAANTVRRKRRRAGRLRLHRIFVILFLLSAGAVLCLTVFFKIEAVNVVGTDKYTPEEVAAESGVTLGSNLFRIDKKLIAASLLEKFPYIESVEINRKLPAAVEIHVVQSVPDGVVKEDDDYVLITRDGKVLERGIMYIPETVPLIIGLDTKGVQPGHYLGEWQKAEKGENETKAQKEFREKTDEENAGKSARTKESLTMLHYLFDAMEASGFTDITNVDITDRLNMRVMYENRLLLELGSEADMSYKLELLKVIIGEKLEPQAMGIIFADNARDKKVRFRPAEGYEVELEMGEDGADEESGEVGDGQNTAEVTAEG